MAIIMLHSNCFSQWDKLYPKEKFTFSLTRIKTNNDTNDTLSVEKKSVAVVLDTIINIRNRKMFVFDKCLNGLLFNSSAELIKGKIKDNDYSTLEALYGGELIDGQQDFSDRQITVFYQVDSFIYVITMPKEFRKTVLKNHTDILNIDNLLVSNVIDTVSNDMKDYSIMFMSYNMPVSQLLVLGNQVEEPNARSDYPLYSLAKITKMKVGDNKDSVYLYERYRRASTIGRLFFSRNWLIHSESLAYTKKYTYYNLVDIKRN